MNEIPLDHWLQDRIEALAEFAAMWREEQKQHGVENYPEKMNLGDWDEQFTLSEDL